MHLSPPVFSHGQLYVALSRAKTLASVKVLLHDDNAETHDKECTRNVVNQEILALASAL